MNRNHSFLLPARHGTRGAAITEMVVVIPLFLVLLGGVVDLGQQLRDRTVLLEAARAAARTVARSTHVHDRNLLGEQGTAVVRQFLKVARYDRERYRAEARVIPFPLSGQRTTSAIQVTVIAESGLRPFFFLPGRPFGARVVSVFRLENAPVTTPPVP